MKHLPRVQPLSVVVGLAIAAALALVFSFAPPAAQQTIVVSYGPHPKDMVQVKEGATYIVPTGKIFVLTGLGSAVYGAGGFTQLKVNGIDEATAMGPVYGSGSANSSSSPTVVPVPVGLAIPAGATITVTGGLSYPDDARAWGYLAAL